MPYGPYDWGDEIEDTLVVLSNKKNEPKVFNREVLSVFGSTDPQDPVDAKIQTDQTWKEHQAKVPRLPVLHLESTCALYLSSLEGLLTADDYDTAAECVREFIKENGTGETLQRLLEEREAKKESPSWLEPWWDDAYLCTRDPIPINVNYFFGFEPHPDPACANQLGRASSLLHAAATVCAELRNGTWSLDYERGKPLCMSQYSRVFCASRVPGLERDTIKTYTTRELLPDEQISRTVHEYVRVDPTHVVVLIRNRFFHFNVLETDPNTGYQVVVPIERIVQYIDYIRRTANEEGSFGGAPVGIFTTMERTSWFEVREEMSDLSDHNAAAFETIQSALLVLVLDCTSVTEESKAARQLLHGPGTNRWFDRHNLIVSENGCAGINFEHSVGDGTTTLRIADTMYRRDVDNCLTEGKVQDMLARCTNWPEVQGGVRELLWKLSGELDQRMKDAFEDFKTHIMGNETTAVTFGHFGGDFIKKAKLSPDAFVQLAFQLTYYRLFGRNDATYAAASTRAFLHGRTEVVRSVTSAAVDFCHAVDQPIFARRSSSKVPIQLKLLRDAAEAHVAYMNHAKQGKGVDRHLLALRLLATENNIEMPSIFLDPSFKKSSHWCLSTSHCGSSALSQFGFGPVVNDGFGLGYMIKNDKISVVVTSKVSCRATSSLIFARMLEASLLHMMCIVESEPDRRSQQPQTMAFAHPTTTSTDFDYEPARGFKYRNMASWRSSRSIRTSNPGTAGPQTPTASAGTPQGPRPGSATQ